MSFQYDFAIPRSHSIKLDVIASTGGATIASKASGFFQSAKGLFAKSSDKPAAVSSSLSSAEQSSSAPSSSSSSYLTQIDPSNPLHNLTLAMQVRKEMEIALLTKRIVDKQIEFRRIPLIDAYLTFIHTIVEQYMSLDDSARHKIQDSLTSTSNLEWCTVLITGARPDANDRVPYVKYEKFDLQQELAHVYFTLGISHYQCGGSLTFHSSQLASAIPACTFMELLPHFAGRESASPPAVTVTPPKRMFNPLSYVPPPPSATASQREPKSPEEIARSRSEIIAKRKLAVQSLRTAAGIFDYMSHVYLPKLPLPREGIQMPDTMIAVSEAFSLLCLVHVQQHTILSALVTVSQQNDGASMTSSSSSVSPMLLAKLSHGIVTQLAQVVTLLKDGTGAFYRAIEFSLHEFIRLTSDYYAGMRLIYLGVDCEVRGDHGRSITFFRQGLLQLQPLTQLNLATIRDCNPVLSEMKQWLTAEVDRVETVLKRLEYDNEHVTFETIPKWEDVKKDVDEMGDGIFMPKPLTYTPPPTLEAMFVPGTPSAKE